MRQQATTRTLRDDITALAARSGLEGGCYAEMLDYTIELFESHGLGTDYYGYHNITHELEVTYVTLLAASSGSQAGRISAGDLRHLYAAALLHDFDPQKSVDKPHEESVIRFISLDVRLQGLIRDAGMDLELIKALIHRTSFPWEGQMRAAAERRIAECFQRSPSASGDMAAREHWMELGWFLSIADRVAGYATGDFRKSMELAKMNAHASAWHPSLIVQRSVAYFERLLNAEGEMLQRVLGALPNHMRRNFMDTVMSFFRLRQREIQVKADHVYEDLRIVPTIERMDTRRDPRFVAEISEIYDELPRPLQFARDGFAESVRDPGTILNTIRLGSSRGEVVGFAKGGALEGYELRPEVRDENYGLGNTVFLEPLALKMGYWGLGGGSEMRHLFTMQAHAKKFEYLTSFALRDVIRRRVESNEGAEFVSTFDPERWDYYRIRL